MPNLDPSADGKRLVFSSYGTNINLAEVALDAPVQPGSFKWLTTDSARGELYPAYSPDGKHIAYFSARNGAENEGIWVMEADGFNAVQLVSDEPQNIMPRWMGDSETLVYGSTGRGADINVSGAPADFRTLTPSRAAPQILPVRGRGICTIMYDVSRDGRLVYFSPDESAQVFTLATQQISDGQELFYLAPDTRLMAVPIRLAPDAHTLEAGAPVALFPTRLATGGNIPIAGFPARAQYAVAADGRFL
jgi:hypothetical protein